MSSPKNTKVKEAKADSKAKKEKKDSDKKEVLHVEKKKPADEPDIVTEAAVEEPDVIAEPPPPPYVPPTRFERRLSVRPLANTAITKQARHYVIGVRTGDRSYSSTEANVFCRLMGTKGTTPEFQLHRTFLAEKPFKFEKGAAAQFSVETEDVGDVKIVHIRQDTPDVAQAWFLAYVTVRQEGQTQKKHFPYYKWVFNQEIDLLEGNASLLQNEVIDAVRATRTDYVRSMREHYRWSADSTLKLPGFIADGSPDTLPLDDQYDNVRKKHYYGRLAREITEELDIVNIPAYAGQPQWESLEDLSMLFYDDFEAPRILDTWAEDKEFGRQYLQGCNPVLIKRCDALPENFPVNDRMLVKVLPKGDTLEALAKDGRLYLADYALLDGVPTLSKGKQRRYVTAPLCLFYVAADGAFLPIAIQLHQKAGDENPIFTPADSEADWTVAKIWVRCADTQLHQVATCMLSHHLLVESVIVALLRNLHPAHPLYKLLRPHFHNTLAINVLMRRELIDPLGPTFQTLAVAGGGHLRLLERAFASWSFRDWIVPDDLARRGVADTTKLPGYLWRDDALLLWGAITEFAKKILAHHYSSDKAVQSDPELQAFAAELSEKGMKGHDFPAKIDTVTQLVEIVSAVMFAATAGHSSTHYSEFDHYVSIPSQPRALYQPPPKQKGVLTMDNILTLLPSGDAAIASVGMSYELSRYSKNQIFLGSYPEPLFTDSAPVQFVSQFQDDLWAISRQIHARNATVEAPYVFLLPERITTSVTS